MDSVIKKLAIMYKQENCLLGLNGGNLSHVVRYKSQHGKLRDKISLEKNPLRRGHFGG